MMTERNLVEVVLEDPVHEDGVVSLPEGLVNEQLCLLGNVQLGNLASVPTCTLHCSQMSQNSMGLCVYNRV